MVISPQCAPSATRRCGRSHHARRAAAAPPRPQTHTPSASDRAHGAARATSAAHRGPRRCAKRCVRARARAAGGQTYRPPVRLRAAGAMRCAPKAASARWRHHAVGCTREVPIPAREGGPPVRRHTCTPRCELPSGRLWEWPVSGERAARVPPHPAPREIPSARGIRSRETDGARPRAAQGDADADSGAPPLPVCASAVSLSAARRRRCKRRRRRSACRPRRRP